MWSLCLQDKHNLTEVVQMCQQLRSRQQSTSPDVHAYPDSILVYLVHALAHHPSCPDPDDCKDVKAYEPIYWYDHFSNFFCFFSTCFCIHAEDKAVFLVLFIEKKNCYFILDFSPLHILFNLHMADVRMLLYDTSVC